MAPVEDLPGVVSDDGVALAVLLDVSDQSRRIGGAERRQDAARRVTRQ